MKISKEKVIVLTSYERSSLLRFLLLYLISVFVLLTIIGYLFFENTQTSLKSATKFEMMYQARNLKSDIVMKAMKSDNKVDKDFNLIHYLKTLKHCRFPVGYYDKNQTAIYSELDEVIDFEKDFFERGMEFFTVTRDLSQHLGVHYIVLKEKDFSLAVGALRIKIIGYLILSFILMGVVGYFLGRLFLKPVREQIESLDKFISDTTHELNTPISAILMTIQSLRNVEDKKMKRLEVSAKRLSLMYSSLTYRLESGIAPSQELCLAEILQERIDFMSELMESKRLHLEMKLSKTPIKMPQDSLDRLIDNLLSNAIKYSDIGDTISIRLEKHILEVQDTGIGIERQKQEDIFRRYYRANDERGGFGIGLNIVLSICKKYKIN
ncbi:MAG: HAMP domain-containing sensor histidine kinase [Sulfurovum sp.]|nr:HAMP domain-containing sensor histidine kinase [Sulfurovum sp.]